VLARKMLNDTGCDGILVARGALGNPWIFRQIDDYLKNGAAPGEISVPEKKRVLKRHFAYLKEHRDTSKKGMVGFMRKIAMWYLKGIPGAARFREKIMRAGSYDEIVRISSED
jgi:tRNA-dihydrouridine synthase